MDKAGVPRHAAFFHRDADGPHREARVGRIFQPNADGRTDLETLAQDPVRP